MLTFNIDAASRRQRMTFSDLLQPTNLVSKLPDFFVGDHSLCERIRYPTEASAAPLQSVVLVSYVVDWDWLATVLPAHVDTTVCINWLPETRDSEEPIAKFEVGTRLAQLPAGRANDSVKTSTPVRPNIRVVHPLLEAGLMHAKLGFLDFGCFLRVFVASANLTLDDWTNLSQAVFFVDLPPAKVDGDSQRAAPEPFESQLRDAVAMLGLADQAFPIMSRFDFSGVDARIVLSVPSQVLTAALAPQAQASVDQEEDDDEEDEEDDDHHSVGVSPEQRAAYQRVGGKNGMDSLADAVAWARAQVEARAGGTCPWSSTPVVYQASSIGGITDDLLAYIERSVGSTPAAPLQCVALFPSLASVQGQLAQNNHGAITLRCFQMNNVTLWSQRWHDLTSATPFHSKLLHHTCRGVHGEEFGWVYSGSHNFTADSWCFTRRIPVAAAASFRSNPRNFELGVVIPCGPSTPLSRIVPADFFPAAPPPAGAQPDPFVFLKHRGVIMDALRQADFSNSDPARYHWHKFLSEYHNPYGRH
jgi:hypothetical protein